MAAMALLPLTLLLSLHISSATGSLQSPVPTIIHETCKASRDNAACEAWLSGPSVVPPNATVPQVIHSALGITSQNLAKAQSILRDILNSSAGNINRTTAANNCLDLFHRAQYRLNLTEQALGRKSLKDARAWLSATLAQNYDCWNRLKYVNDTAQVVRAMEFCNSSVIPCSSSTLGMIMNYDIHGEMTSKWGPPKTEREGFWEKAAVSLSGSQGLRWSGGVPQGLKENVSVCKSGCQFKRVQEAVNAAPNNTATGSGDGKRFVIRIRAGVYSETVRIPLEKRNVVFLGDGMGKTVITGSRNAGQTGVSTYESATVGVDGDGFMASGITFENTAAGHQAVAFRSDSDRSVIENCEFLGNQDTLYAHTLRQFYKSCRIQGNVDFIFGNAAAVFQDCMILIAPRPVNPEKGETNAVTAHGRIDPAQTTGFVFLNSVVNGTDTYNNLYRKNPKVHKNFLGRPWKEFSRTVFIECVLEPLIAADGWLPWTGDFALKTLYYGEFNNTGGGSNKAKRVPWSSQIPKKHVGYYSVSNFIQGDKWIVDSGRGQV